MHPFFAEKAAEVKNYGLSLINDKTLRKLKFFKINSVFQREMIGLMVQAFNDAKELRRVNSIFMAIDQDYSGTLSLFELKKLFKDFGQELTDREVEGIIDSLYITEKGAVTFLEFQAGLLEKSFYMDEKRV